MSIPNGGGYPPGPPPNVPGPPGGGWYHQVPPPPDGPPGGPPPYGYPYGPPPPPGGGNRTGVIVGVIALVVVIIGGVVAGVLLTRGDDGEDPVAGPSTGSTAGTATPPATGSTTPSTARQNTSPPTSRPPTTTRPPTETGTGTATAASPRPGSVLGDLNADDCIDTVKATAIMTKPIPQVPCTSARSHWKVIALYSPANTATCEALPARKGYVGHLLESNSSGRIACLGFTRNTSLQDLKNLAGPAAANLTQADFDSLVQSYKDKGVSIT
ncbi:hypothetical protein OG216_45285 [Streptomycetaceae bacterium NBC_01309]